MNIVKSMTDLLGDIYPEATVRVLETHISWVFLTGSWAYKIKKPIQTPFLDYGTLERRKANCFEELRVNTRFAPAIYDSVIPIYLGAAGLNLDAEGEVVEYAIRMREFPQSAVLLEMLKTGSLTEVHIRSLSEELAKLHAEAHRAATHEAWGRPDRIIADVLENFHELDGLLPVELASRLDPLRKWVDRKSMSLASEFERRRNDGMVRDCHGDLHLGNLIWYEGRVQAFDGIEFSLGLRWIDVANDLAFVLMDLKEHGARSAANRVLNGYLQASGDWDGLRVLKYYEHYRAMVRAKTSALRARQNRSGQISPSEWNETKAYFDVAGIIGREFRPILAITHGLSGSGKTFGTNSLLDVENVIRIRSDVERKRRAGIKESARSGADLARGIYEPHESDATYQALARAAGSALQGGFHVIVDACFLKQQQRTIFRDLACATDSCFRIVDFEADQATLQARILERYNQSIDASEATLGVLHWQQKEQQPINNDEFDFRVNVVDLSKQLSHSTGDA